MWLLSGNKQGNLNPDYKVQNNKKKVKKIVKVISRTF